MNVQLAAAKNGGFMDNENEPKAPQNAVLQTIDLNSIIKEIFSVQRKKLDELKVISRCDIMPIVESDYEKLSFVINSFINFILNDPPAKHKLFLYIKCDMKPSEVMDLSLPLGYTFYQVSFNANSDVCSKPEFKEMWNNCEAMVRSLPNSSLSLSHTNTGCLFSISLPGKLN